MFDINLLGKPGLQPEIVNNSISYLIKEVENKVTSDSIIDQKQLPGSRVKFLLFFGFIFTVIMAYGLIYYFSLLNQNNLKEISNYEIKIPDNEIVSGIIDLLLNKELMPYIELIEFKKNEIEIIYNQKNEKQIHILNKNDFFGINVRTRIDQMNKYKYIYRIPWQGFSDPLNQDLSQIKNKIGEHYILSNSYDFSTDSNILIINEYKNLVSILLRLHESKSLHNYNIKIEHGPHEFSTISLKPF